MKTTSSRRAGPPLLYEDCEELVDLLADYKGIEAIWYEYFPGVPLDPTEPWPAAGALALGKPRTPAHYDQLLFGATCGDKRDDQLLAAYGKEIRDLYDDLRLFRDRHKVGVFAACKERRQSVITSHGVLHLGSLMRALRALYPAEEGYSYLLLEETAARQAYMQLGEEALRMAIPAL